MEEPGTGEGARDMGAMRGSPRDWKPVLTPKVVLGLWSSNCTVPMAMGPGCLPDLARLDEPGAFVGVGI